MSTATERRTSSVASRSPAVVSRARAAASGGPRRFGEVLLVLVVLAHDSIVLRAGGHLVHLGNGL